MLPDVHEVLRRLLHERGGIDPADVEIRFDAPSREMTDRLLHPAISFFLIEALENTDLRQGGPGPVRAISDGQATRRMPPRRIDLRYVVSAITTDAGDEHRLLWRALATLLRWQQLPLELLPESVRLPEIPITARVAQPDDTAGSFDLWAGLGIPPRLSFSYVLTVPMDLEITFSAPLVLTRTTRYLRSSLADANTRHSIGGYVRDAAGQPLGGVMVTVEGTANESTTASTGQWQLADVDEAASALVVTLPNGQSRRVEIVVPSHSYDITID